MTAPIFEYPRDWYRAVTCTFALQSRSQISNQTWIGGKNVYGPHAQLWICKMSLAPQAWNVDGQAMAAFFSRLDGQVGFLRIGHSLRQQPLYNRRLTASVQNWSDDSTFTDGTGWESGLLPPMIAVDQAATQGDNFIVVRDLPASTASALKRGDLIEFRPNGAPDGVPRLHEVMHDVPTNAAGKAGFEFRPRLRAGLASGDMAVLDDPRSVFHCVDDEQGVAENDVAGHSRPAFTLVEALDRIP